MGEDEPGRSAELRKIWEILSVGGAEIGGEDVGIKDSETQTEPPDAANNPIPAPEDNRPTTVTTPVGRLARGNEPPIPAGPDTAPTLLGAYPTMRFVRPPASADTAEPKERRSSLRGRVTAAIAALALIPASMVAVKLASDEKTPASGGTRGQAFEIPDSIQPSGDNSSEASEKNPDRPGKTADKSKTQASSKKTEEESQEAAAFTDASTPASAAGKEQTVSERSAKKRARTPAKKKQNNKGSTGGTTPHTNIIPPAPTGGLPATPAPAPLAAASAPAPAPAPAPTPAPSPPISNTAPSDENRAGANAGCPTTTCAAPEDNSGR